MLPRNFRQKHYTRRIWPDSPLNSLSRCLFRYEGSEGDPSVQGAKQQVGVNRPDGSMLSRMTLKMYGGEQMNRRQVTLRAADAAGTLAVLARAGTPVPAATVRRRLEVDTSKRIAIGALYATLHRLASGGDVLITQDPLQPQQHLFQITEAGRRRLASEERGMGNLRVAEPLLS